MFRLSMNEMTTYRWPFETDVSRYTEAGFRAIGVWRRKITDYGEEKGRELLAEKGLSVSNLLWAGGFTGSECRTQVESLADAEEAIRLAADLRAGCLVVYTGPRNGHLHKHCRRLVRSALKEVTAMAADLGVTLALEPMSAGCAAEWTFLTDLPETLNMIDSIESPFLKLAFDTYHLGQDLHILEVIPDIVDRIAIVHLGDSLRPPDGEQNRCQLGKGNLPLRRIISALSAAGYDGDFDVELIGEDLEMADYTELITHSQQAFAEMVGTLDRGRSLLLRD